MMNSHENRPLVKDINCTADLKRDSAFTTQPTTLGNALQFPVSNATDNTLQPSLITSNSNATLRFTDEQDVRPILGDDSEGSQE
ncbi:hypothetical protein [Candidatus Tisiphia endosymbiont of Stenodema calcarata]|uniref:hypothetical protein n=1 Tax=Candidatus Tisiphia endosymbiont of Stenodema calcarata TaxID=3139337 RepID=UPI003CCB51BB